MNALNDFTSTGSRECSLYTWTQKWFEKHEILLPMERALNLEDDAGNSTAVCFVKDTVSSAELNSLYELFNSTNGKHWHWENASDAGAIWNFSVPNPNPCCPLWQGLACDCESIHCVITDIRLPDHNLTGKIPDSIVDLSSLNRLQLFDNHLSGSIPENIGTLISLKLYLDNNDLTGTIPLGISNLTDLLGLYLGKNKLRGPIFEEIGNL